MKHTALLLTLGLASLTACSEAAQPGANFSDPISAMSQAEAAAAAGNVETAQAAYAYAIEEGGADIKADALYGLLHLQLKRGMESDAMNTFERLTRDFQGRIESSDVISFLQTADAESLAQAGHAMLIYAGEHFPEAREELTKLEASFDELRANAPSDLALEELGYPGE